jgi:hypothetical protein
MAEQLSTEAKVALKLLLPHLLESEEGERLGASKRATA